MIEGTVKAVSRTGKGVNINDQWYNTGKPIFQPTLKGSVIKFSVNDKGFVDGGYELVEAGSPAAQQTKSSGGAKKKFIDNSVGMGIGMAINNAVQLSIAENNGFDKDYVRATAIDIYQLAEELKEQAQNGSFDVASKVSEAVAEEGEDDNPFV